MKRAALIVLILLIPTGSLSALDLFLGVTGGPFFPTDENFKEIYGPGFQLGAEASIQITKLTSVRMGAAYRASSGELSYSGDSTRLEIFPLELGIRAELSIGRFTPYLDGGIGLFFFREDNPIGTVSDSGFGFLGQAGFLFSLASRISLDLRFRWDSCKVDPTGESVNIGGILALAGLRYQF